MLSSSLVYFLRVFLPKPKLPSGNVVEYELRREQEIELLKKGRTIVKFFFSEKCEDCEHMEDVLEEYAYEYPDLFVEKIRSNESKIVIIGFNVTNSSLSLQRKVLEELDEKSLREALCDLMLNPPVECIGL